MCNVCNVCNALSLRASFKLQYPFIELNFCEKFVYIKKNTNFARKILTRYIMRTFTKSLLLGIIFVFAACETNFRPNGADNRTPIDSSECYMLQEWNELGEPVKSYGCMRFDHNAGSTFAETYAGIKSEIESLANQYINDEIKSGNSNADKWELRQVIRNVTNSPNDKLIYTSIELYMYSSIWGAYTIVNQYCVIDSEGNIYYVITPDD